MQKALTVLAVIFSIYVKKVRNMTTLAKAIKSETKILCKKFPNLTFDEALNIVRFTMNRYVGHLNFHDLIMSQETKDEV